MSTSQLTQLLYRSVAVAPFSDRELSALARQAQQRNAAASLSGLLVYDRGRFVQWLEGPWDNLHRVWESIQRDPRHHRIERLHAPWSPQRLFPDWSMQLGMADADGTPQALSLPAEALRELRERVHEVRQVLQGVAFWSRLPEPAAMVKLLARGAEDDVYQLGQLIMRSAPSWPAIGMHLLGPAARALAEAWNEDSLDAADLVVAQGRLQALLREVRSAPAALAPRKGKALIAPLPGERDLTGITFAGIALDAAGWQVCCEFPASNAALQACVARQSYDVLHLALSDGFARDHRMAEVAQTVRDARRAAANPRMQVLLSGRAFIEQPGLATLLGADGDGLAQGSSVHDLESMMAWASIRSASPAMMVAQAALLDVCQEIQRLQFGPGQDQAGEARRERGLQ
jgi:hypothetical protein